MLSKVLSPKVEPLKCVKVIIPTSGATLCPHPRPRIAGIASKATSVSKTKMRFNSMRAYLALAPMYLQLDAPALCSKRDQEERLCFFGIPFGMSELLPVFAALSNIAGRYEEDIWSYVNTCPFHLFDTERGRNISRPEFMECISIEIKTWLEFPLSCSEVVDTILDAVRLQPLQFKCQARHIHPYVFSAMTKSPVIDGMDRFLFALTNELQTFDLRPSPDRHPLLIHPILRVVRDLIERKRSQASPPCRQEVKEQIEFAGQYAILSHRWDEEELSFADAANLSDPSVQAKKGLRKLRNFAKAVKSHYGCRYLWIDTVCIDEADRDMAIRLMFEAGPFKSSSQLAASKSSKGRGRIDGLQWSFASLMPAEPLGLAFRTSLVPFHVGKSLNWLYYKPGLQSAMALFCAMHGRQTKIPEDRVYCLLSALNMDIPIKYGEGFDRAFLRLQVHYLTQTHDRQCFIWSSSSLNRVEIQASPFNSMLPADFDAYSCFPGIDRQIKAYAHIELLPDRTISFGEDSVMRIMVSLFPWSTIPHDSWEPSLKQLHEPDLIFASLHFRSLGRYYGVLLRPLPSTRLHAATEHQDNSSEEEVFGGDKRVIYERVSLKVVWSFDLPSHDSQEPEWVYIR
ncbi:hypothetical protein CCMSSC00406_0006382 [Pleurotus cornucopiae]|uniref:Uncharacterized protein n=1 Tax=Pleurotus cornucopiae TaxID=5321 RepID=A0ACB7IPY2_PLECO|nr:hypothetical protein CCMSSC00406_0006382 [Pleurotus cornucopiae]